MNAVIPARGRFLKFREACQYLGFINADGTVDEQHLRRLVAAKKIPVQRDGRLGFYERDLDEWMTRRRSPDQAELKERVQFPRIDPKARPSGDVSDLFTRRRLSKTS